MADRMTQERVNELLAASRIRMEEELSSYAPDALRALHEVAVSADPGKVSKEDREWMEGICSRYGIPEEMGPELLMEIRARFCKAPASARVAAAKDLVAQVRPQPKAESEDPKAPVFNITINQLSTGERRHHSIAASDAVREAIDIGQRALEDG